MQVQVQVQVKVKGKGKREEEIVLLVLVPVVVVVVVVVVWATERRKAVCAVGTFDPAMHCTDSACGFGAVAAPKE
jgi:hypothetical protein